MKLVAQQLQGSINHGCLALFSISHPYTTDFHAVVTSVDGPLVTLHQSAFHSFGGVELSDHGLIADVGVRGATVTPKRSDAFSAGVQHLLANGADATAFPHGRLVEGSIDWQRRHRLMRLTTAVHLLAIAAAREQGLQGPETAHQGDIGLVVTYRGTTETADHAAVCQSFREIIADDLEVAQSKSPANPTEFYCHIDGLGFSPTEHPMLRSTAEIGNIVLESVATTLGVTFILSVPT